MIKNNQAGENDFQADRLRTHLYFDRIADEKVYAILDGASIPGLLKKLHQEKPNHVCLFGGELDPSVKQTAPYLVELEAHSPFAEWLFDGWGEHWGIYFVSDEKLKSLKKHLKKFLLVSLPSGKQHYFRYYDPRVFRVFVPTCNAEECEQIFGPIQMFFCEGENKGDLLCYRVKEEQAHETRYALNIQENIG